MRLVSLILYPVVTTSSVFPRLKNRSSLLRPQVSVSFISQRKSGIILNNLVPIRKPRLSKTNDKNDCVYDISLKTNSSII